MKISEIVYKRYNVENIIKIYEENALIIKKAKNKLEVLNARKNVISAEVKLDTAFNLAYIRWSLNTVNEFYLAEKTYYEENVPLTLKAKSKYLKAFLNSKFLEEISPLFISAFMLSNSDAISDDLSRIFIKRDANCNLASISTKTASPFFKTLLTPCRDMEKLSAISESEQSSL